MDDNHADIIVKILKEIYEPMGVSNDAVMKITGSIGGGNPKKVQEAIKRFKNEKYPNIAVTVDLLTTGIDVPEITTLVFMRRVKSRILFEQMMGRATRLCPDIGKTHFEIYDPVGVYESLDPVSTMKPVVKSESKTFEDILNGLEVLETDQQLKNQIDILIAKIQRKKLNLSEKALEQFTDLSGGLNPEEFIDNLHSMSVKDAKEYALKNQKLFQILNEGGLPLNRPMIISDKPDELVSHTRGYGDGKAPQDYLEEFSAFVKENVEKIATLQVIRDNPQELTRTALKSLELELDRHNFTQKQLNTAWKDWKNEDIEADIISFIRHSILNSQLIPHNKRIYTAVEKLRNSHDFNKMQKDWLIRIEENLMTETIIDRETFEMGAFKTAGGYNRVNKIFGGELDSYLNELNSYLYDDKGITA